MAPSSIAPRQRLRRLPSRRRRTIAECGAVRVYVGQHISAKEEFVYGLHLMMKIVVLDAGSDKAAAQPHKLFYPAVCARRMTPVLRYVCAYGLVGSFRHQPALRLMGQRRESTREWVFGSGIHPRLQRIEEAQPKGAGERRVHAACACGGLCIQGADQRPQRGGLWRRTQGVEIRRQRSRHACVMIGCR